LEHKSICELVRQAEENQKHGVIRKSQYVTFEPQADLDKISAYVESKHISGLTDDLGREKPFFNIGIAIRNLWFRATEIMRKNFRLKATKSSHFLLAFLANIHLRAWMRKSDFGQFLNDWGLALATYNSAVSKHIEKDGELISKVIPWSKIICDFVDFENNQKIEKLYFTPAQLRQNENYNKELVEELIRSKSTRKTLSGQQVDSKADYIEVYEVHGELPLSHLTDKEKDENVYQQQMHVVAFNQAETGKYSDYTLFSGREKQDPYMLASLIPDTDGGISLSGSIKLTFENQWMVNDTAKKVKDMLELASLILLQTSDNNFQGRNALVNLQQGDILVHAQNQPLTQLNNKADINALQSFGQQWEVLAKEITSTPESLRGETLPSGTPYSLGAYLGGQAGSLFVTMTKNKGLALERMARKFILPYLKKKMDTTEEIAETLESHEIKQIDAAFVPNEAIRIANEQIKTDILNGKLTQQPDLGAIESQIRAKLGSLGNQRFIRPSDIISKKWRDIFKDFIWEIEVEVTNEETDKQATLQTLSTIMQTVAANPLVLQDPNMRLIFNRVLELTGVVSPVEISQTESQPQLQQGQPLQPTAQTGGRQVEMAMNNLQTR